MKKLSERIAFVADLKNDDEFRQWSVGVAALEAENDAQRKRLDALERLVIEARIFIGGDKGMADWVSDAPDWELSAAAALAQEKP